MGATRRARQIRRENFARERKLGIEQRHMIGAFTIGYPVNVLQAPAYEEPTRTVSQRDIPWPSAHNYLVERRLSSCGAASQRR